MGLSDVLGQMLSKILGPPKINVGAIAPVGVEGEGPDEATQFNGLGLDDRNAVLKLVHELTLDSDPIHRMTLRRKRRAREYAAGRMLVFWNAQTQSYTPYTQENLAAFGLSDSAEDDEEEDPIFNFPIYQANMRTIIAALSADRPTTKAMPGDAQNELDVRTANSCSDVVSLFERNNQIELKNQELAYFFHTDGFAAAHVRYVQDEKRWGTVEVKNPPEPRQVQTGPGGWMCQGCGMETSDEEAPMDESGAPVCKACGAPLPPEGHHDPVMATVMDVDTGTHPVPSGAELVDFYGQLEVRVPPEAKEQSQYLYLSLDTENDIAIVRALYVRMGEEIQAGASGDDALLQEGRTARASTNAGGWQSGLGYAVEGQKNEVTFSRTWLRPAAFYRLKDKELRDNLLRTFQKGLMIAAVGPKVLEIREADMDDEWVCEHAYPGPGQIRPSIGDAALDVQDAFNDLMDSEMSAARHATPWQVYDSSAVDLINWSQSKQQGGNVYEAKNKSDRALQENFFENTPSTMPPGVGVLRQELGGPILQQLTGAYPAALGAGDPDLKTFRAYAQARDQAMQQFGIVWKRMKSMYVRIHTLVVMQFLKNRPADVSFAVTGDGGFENKTIKLADLRGNFKFYPESDEAFPVSAADRRETINNFFGSPNPFLNGAATSLENLQGIKSLMGLSFMKFPGEAAWRKQAREIKKLLTQKPLPVPDPMDPTGQTPALDPMTGQPMFISSIPVRALTDDHPVEAACCKAWLNSDEGMDAEESNPEGHQNVLLHAEEHIKAMQPPPAPPPPQQQGATDTSTDGDLPALTQ